MRNPTWTDKQKIREKIWRNLENKDIARFPLPTYGRIPNFVGVEKAVEKLFLFDFYKKAKCVFCAPDFVLKKVRENVLLDNKILAVATPHTKKILEISDVSCRDISYATSIKGFEKFGVPLKTKVELFVQGSVAVDLRGNRLGKGSGYGDAEFWYLKKNNLIVEGAKKVTIVHEEQIVEDISILMNEKDVKMDYIITPSRIIVVE